mgnify:CR=1 FL=1
MQFIIKENEMFIKEDDLRSYESIRKINVIVKEDENKTEIIFIPTLYKYKKGDLKGASMRDIVIANKNKYIYNGKLYDDISIKRVISKEIELYVMEEDLLIKTYDEIKNDKEDIVYEIINEEYGSEKSALMHYEYDKKRKKFILVFHW